MCWCSDIEFLKAMPFVICGLIGRRCVPGGVLYCLQNQSISLKDASLDEVGICGTIQASIFSSSCYSFANNTAPLLVHSGWVLVACNLVKPPTEQ